MTRALAVAGLALAGCPHRAAAVVVEDAGLSDAGGGTADPAAVVRAARAEGSESQRATAWSVPLTASPADELAAGLADPAPWVQQAVVRALAALGAREALARTAADPAVDPYVRADAALAAGVAPDVLAGWAEAGEGAELPLSFAAASLGDADARSALEQRLATGDLPLEPAFFATLSSRPDPGLAAALARAQPRVEEELALTIAAARLRLGDGDAAGVLRDGLSSADEERRLEVLDLLVGVPGPEADALVARARKDSSPFVATYAGLLASSRSGSDAPAFSKALASTEWELRQLAVRLVVSADHGADRTVERVVRAGLADPSAVVRAEAAAAAHTADLRQLAPELRGLVGDPSPEVSLAAAATLLRW